MASRDAALVLSCRALLLRSAVGLHEFYAALLEGVAEVRKTPSWPRSWANCSVL